VPTYSYNSANELTSSTAGSYTYDNNGNTLTDATGKSYAWDFENRLTQVSVPQTGGGSTLLTFKYDPFGRRIQKSDPSGTTNYLYDRINSIEELDPSGAVVSRYAQATGIDEPLADVRSGMTNFYDADGVNSITSLTNANGSLVQTYIFDSFGIQTASSGSLVNPFQYTGREADSETGLYYYQLLPLPILRSKRWPICFRRQHS
jgi:YD repeat-containing protein